MKVISQAILISMFVLSSSVYAHPGHSHAELTFSQILPHVLVWGGLLVAIIAGTWLLNRARQQRMQARHGDCTRR